MNRLPTEILILIFKHLHIKQKLQCMLVCHHWSQALQQGYLFETIQFTSFSIYKDAFQDLRYLLRKATSGSRPGRKCRRLLLDIYNTYVLDYSDTAHLLTAFPNLTHFYSNKSLPYYSPKSKAPQSVTLDSDPFLGWRANLKTFIVDGTIEDAFDNLSNMLSTGVFSRLTVLYIPYIDFYRETSISKLISRLKNAPEINTLKVSLACFSLAHLESIHSNLPKLTSLTLKSELRKCNDNDAALLSVIPAEKVRVLILINSSYPYPDCDKLSSYIKLKYPCLDKLSCDCTNGSTRNIFSDSKFAEFITTFDSGLKECTVRLQEMSTETVNLFEHNMVQLETLGTDISVCKNIFKKIELDLEDQGANSRMFSNKSIDFKKFTQLKELTLDFSITATRKKRHYQITFGEILDKLPETLQSLCLIWANVIVGRQKEIVKVSSSIANLKLCHVNILETGISFSLARSFPKLKSLILNSCDLNNIAAIDLPKHHLQYFEFNSTLPSAYNTAHLIHFILAVPDQKIYYKVPKIDPGIRHLVTKRKMNPHDRSIQQILKPSPDPGRRQKKFHFTCASVQTVSCGDYLLLI